MAPTVAVGSPARVTAPARLVHDGTSYPARPVGLPPGMADYIGPAEPSDWANGDTWTEVGS